MANLQQTNEKRITASAIISLCILSSVINVIHNSTQETTHLL